MSCSLLDSWNQPWSCHPSQESSELSSGSHTVNKSIMKNHAKWSNGYWGSDDVSLELRTFTVSVLYKALISRDIVLVSKEGSPLRCTADSGAAVRKASRVQRLSRAWGVWMKLPGEVSTSKRTQVGELLGQLRTYEQGRRAEDSGWSEAGFDFLLPIPAKLRHKVVFTLNIECPSHRQQWRWEPGSGGTLLTRRNLGQNEEWRQSGRQRETVSINQPVYPSIRPAR